jgi:hypothetical protein
MNSFDAIEFLSKYKEPTITFTVERESGGPARDVELERKFAKVPDPIDYKILSSENHNVRNKTL